MCVFQEFGLLIVLCNHGRHRSVSLACEVSTHTGCDLVSMRRLHRPSQMLHVHDVLLTIAPRLRQHLNDFGSRPHPVAGIHVCRYRFDGTAWAANENPDAPPTRYRHLDMEPPDILVESRCPGEASIGWGFGTLVIHGGGVSPRGWYPRSYVRPMDIWHFDGIYDLYASLVLY